ncbi:MAG: sugar kinase [Alphaproteobacteria bacterium]|nr:sugar kinase [Alphaproteobacteria bacterium]
MKQNNFLFVGEVMLEFTPLNDNSFKQSFAGDSYNSCWYFNKLSKTDASVRAQYLTHLGADSYSDVLIQEMNEQGIDASYIVQTHNKNIGLYIIKNHSNGEREFDYWRENSAATTMFESNESAILDVDAVNQADHIIFSGISIAVLSERGRENLFEALIKLKDLGINIIFDTNFRQKLWPDIENAQKWYDRFYNISNVILPSVEDEMTLFNLSNSKQVLEHLGSYHKKEIVLKNGPRSAVFMKDGNMIDVATSAIENVVDTTSAGDSFNAQYIYSRFVERVAPEIAIKNAHILAGKVIGYKGALISEIFEE